MGAIGGGAASGASAGAAFGPWGAVIGGVAGGVMGAMQDDGGDATNEQADAAGNAANAYNQYAQKALDALNSNYGQARNDINQYYGQAINQGSPYTFAGLNALDQLQQGIGMKTLPGGSFQLKQALDIVDQKSRRQALYSELRDLSDKTNVAAYTHHFGTSPTPGDGRPEQFDLANARQMLDMAKTDYGLWSGDAVEHKDGPDGAFWGGLASQVKDLSKYDSLLQDTPQLSSDQQALIAKYNDGTLGQSATYDKNQALQTFFDNPEYQLLFNQGGATTDPNATVLDRFRADPGYQFAVDQGVKARDASAASKGMLLSGNHLTALTDYGQGMADQQFNSYRDRLANTYGNYLNRLGTVAGYGTQFTSNAQNIYTGQGNNLANISTGLGNQTANIYTGQGDVNANSILAAGNARASGYATQAGAQNQGMGNMLGQLPGLLNNLNVGGSGGGGQVTDWSSTGGRMPQFDMSSFK